MSRWGEELGGELAHQEAVEPGASNLDQGKEDQAEKAMAHPMDGGG